MKTFTFTNEEVLAMENAILEAQTARLRALINKGIGYDEKEYSTLSFCIGKFSRDGDKS
jgi:hypothetical protein